MLDLDSEYIGSVKLIYWIWIYLIWILNILDLDSEYTRSGL